MNINFKQLEAFVRVADLGSFRRAADRLNTTQPNVSTRVSNLEETLGYKLFERDAGSVRMTTRGKAALEDARNVLRAAEQFIDTAGQSNQLESSVKIGVTEMIVNTWLQLFLRAVREHYPKLTVELTVDLSVNLKPELHSRSIDMAFQNGPFTRVTSGSEHLGRFAYVWVAAPDHEINSTENPGFEDMLSVPLLVHGRETNQFQEIEAHFRPARGGNRARIVSSSNISPCVHMAVEGMGVSVLPAAMALPYMNDGRLKVVNYAWVPSPLEFLARYDARTSSAIVGKLAKLASGIALAYQTELENGHGDF